MSQKKLAGTRMDFVADPAYSQVPFADVSKTITVTSATVNISCLSVYGTAALTFYFNSDSTKTYPIDAATEKRIPIHANVNTVTILNASAGTVSVQGM